MTDFSSILQDFVPAIAPKLRTGLQFHRTLAKGGTKPDGTPFINQRTGEPYLITTQLTHVLVGLSALSRLLTYLHHHHLLSQPVTASQFRRVCALFSLHDLHKDEQIAREVSRADTSIQPAQMLAIANRVGLTDWLGADDLNGYEYREAMVHLSDSTHGDRKHCRGEIDYERLYELVRLADTMASVQSLEEGTRGLKNRLKDLARRLKHLQFYYHKITDYRGLTTNLYHQAIAQTLQTQYNLYPLLFFANGTLYLSQGELQDFNRDELLNSVVQSFNHSLQELGEKPGNQPEYNRKTQRFENYVFTFWTAAQVLEFLKSNSQGKVKPGWFQELLQKRFDSYFKDAFETQEKFQELFHIEPTRDRDPNFAEKWAAVNRYLGGVLNLLRDVYLSPDESWVKVISWLSQQLQLSPSLQTSLTESASSFNRAGTPEFSQIMAYHYLAQFNLNGDSALVTPVETILDTLHQQLSPPIIALDSPTKRLNYVEDELALQEDTFNFIHQSLILSWSIDSDKLIDDPLPLVTAKKKTGSPKAICSLCNRVIPKGMKAATIKKDILEDSLKEFSNRLTPKRNVTSRLWCPQCYLEWTVRKLAGLGYAPGAESSKSERLYFFILPNPLLTPELLDVLRDRLQILQQGTTVKIRQYGKGTPSIPKVWLTEHNLTDTGQGKDWLDTTVEVLSEEATRQTQQIEKKGKRNAGDRIISFGIFDDEDSDDLDLDTDDDTDNPAKLPSNFILVTLEASAYKSGESIKATELWMRGLLTALVLQDLLGMRVYLTDKPYLPVAYLDQVTEALALESEHPALRSILTDKRENSKPLQIKKYIPLPSPCRRGLGRGSERGLERGFPDSVKSKQPIPATLSNQLKVRGIPIDEIWYRVCALWVVNESLSEKESTIAQRLTEVNRNELAGARFFADYHRHNTHNVPDVFRQACHILLESFETVEGNTNRMSLKNLAETIASQSLELFLPRTPKDGKGKANRYETIYRTAITELKKVSRQPDLETEELIGHIAGTLIKRLERLDTGISFPFIFKDEDKNQRARQFAQTIVVDLFEQRCHRSFSRLSRYENDLANGVFFYVSEQLSAKWAQWNQQKQQRKVKSDVGATR